MSEVIDQPEARPSALDTKSPLWPQFDPEVMAKYGGTWVIAVEGTIWGWDKDPGAAREMAIAKLKQANRPAPDRLVAVAVCKPENARF